MQQRDFLISDILPNISIPEVLPGVNIGPGHFPKYNDCNWKYILSLVILASDILLCAFEGETLCPDISVWKLNILAKDLSCMFGGGDIFGQI